MPAQPRITVRRPPTGPVRGLVEEGVAKFRGIPYGAPPVGAHRFRPPVAAAPWTEALDCFEDRPIAPQPWDILDEMLDVPRLPYSEADALQLTVRAPESARPGSDLPVMVWIHGGSLTTGSCTWPLYDGTAFARDGVLFVGLNYRLHALGFLDLSSVLGEPDSINLGLRDVVLGLEWVKHNIRAFGGDPDTVTIFGESAGGTLVGALTARPDAPRLFRRAILQSGANLQLIEPDEAARIARNFLDAAGIPNADRATLEALSVDEIVALSQDPRLTDGLPRIFVPWNITRDPLHTPRTGLDAVRAGDLVGVDLMAGWTLDESRLIWLGEDPATYIPPVDAVDAPTHHRLHELYAGTRPELDGPQRAMAISTDQYYFLPAVRIAQAQSERGGQAHLYEFRWPSPVLGGRLGSCHALEIPFVFDQWVSPTFTGADRPEGLVREMHEAWLRFARTGDPGWPAYDTSARMVKVFDLESKVVSDHRGRERAGWDDVTESAIGIL